MKFRKDFVTNSSSSSYVCDICGRSESGWDLVLSDAEMITCENGHTFCEHEILENPTVEDYKDYLIACFARDLDELKKMNEDSEYDFETVALECEFWYMIPEKFCPICSFIVYSQTDLKNYFKKKYEIDENVVFEIVKQSNKRRKKLYDEEYNSYICQKYNLNLNDIVTQWKEEFESYDKFKRYIKN